VADRDFSHQNRNQLGLRAKFEMQVEQQDQADNNPNVDNKVNATANANQGREPGCMGRQPHEIQARGCGQQGEDCDHWRTPIFGPGVDHHICE